MPRAFDRRVPASDHDPLANLLNFNDITQTVEDAGSLIRDAIPNLIKLLTGIDISSPEAFVESVIELITTGGPALQFAEAILDILGTFVGIPNLGDYLTDLGGAFGDIDISNPGAIPAAIADAIAEALVDIPLVGDFAALIAGLINGGQPVNATNIFGSLFPNVIPLIGAGHIGNTQPELLANSNFIGAESITGALGWLYDALAAPPGTPAGAGSAKVVADGVGSKDLLSNLIPVAAGQKLDLSAMSKWTGVTSTGSPIRLGLTTFLNGDAVSTPDITTLAATGTQAVWQLLSGTFTVPSGVDSVRLRMSVQSSATAGTVWFGKGSTKKTGLINTGLIADADGNGLPDILDGLDTALGGALSSLATKIGLGEWTDLLEGLSGGTGVLQDIFDRLDDFLNSGSALPGGNITGSVPDQVLPGLISAFDSIVNRFLGITGTGWGRDDADHALQAQSAVILGLSQQVSQLQTVFTSGVTGGDEFERTASTLGSDWDMGYGSGGGAWKTNGHDAYWDKSGTASRKSAGRYTALTAQTDLMQTTVTLASAPEKPVFPPGSPAYNRVTTRMSADRQNYIYADFGNGQVKIGRVVAGVETELANGSLPSNLGNGSQLTIQAGKPGTARYFQAKLNGGFALDVTEAGATSMLGSSYRQGGFGGEAGGWLLSLTQSAPGRLKSIVVGDQ